MAAMQKLSSNDGQKLELVRCLGWCNKEFLSPNKTSIRYCKKCSAKKEQIEHSTARIRTSSFSLREED
jgi:hypothetical protein